MLPSRGIARSLRSREVWRQLPHQQTPSRSPTLSQGLGNGRSFGTAPRRPGSAAMSPLRSRNIATPVLLAGVASSRSLSLWGYGAAKKPVEEPTPMPAAPTEEPIQPPEPILSEATATTNSTASLESPVGASEMDLSALTDLVNGNDILNMPEQLGYLHAIGLDYGWGPTSVMQFVLEHIHVWGGIGWAGSIIASAFLLRLVMLWPQIQGLKFSTAANKMKQDPRSKEAMELMQRSFREGDPTLNQKGRYMTKILKEEYNVSNYGMLWSFLPIPFSFGLFRIISGMSSIPVPSLETSGFLWFPNLTVADPYYLLPIISSMVMSYSMVLNRANLSPEQAKMTKSIMPVMAVVLIACTSWLSAGINLMGVAFGVATCATTIITTNSLVRRASGLPPMVAPPPPTKPTYEAPRPTGGVADRLKGSLDEMKEGFNSQISSFTGGGSSFSASEQDKAERKRKDLLRKLEDTRKTQEREEFERKYKNKR